LFHIRGGDQTSGGCVGVCTALLCGGVDRPMWGIVKLGVLWVVCAFACGCNMSLLRTVGEVGGWFWAIAAFDSCFYLVFCGT
jgi:hypothetical protein